MAQVFLLINWAACEALGCIGQMPFLMPVVIYINLVATECILRGLSNELWTFRSLKNRAQQTDMHDSQFHDPLFLPHHADTRDSFWRWIRARVFL